MLEGDKINNPKAHEKTHGQGGSADARAAVVDALLRSPIFSQCEPLRLERLYDDGVFILSEYTAGERVEHIGSDGTVSAVGILVSGKASVVRRCDDERSEVTLNLLDKGSCFGVCSVFCGHDRMPPTDIVAGGECRVVFIDGECFEQLILEDKVICRSYLRFLTGRLCFLNEKLYAFSGSTVNERVAQALLSGVRSDGVCYSGSCVALAHQLNIGRASLYRSLDSMVEHGLIKRDSKKIEIIDIEGLASFR